MTKQMSFWTLHDETDKFYKRYTRTQMSFWTLHEETDEFLDAT